MPSRSPSRRSSPLTHHSRESSHRSPSFGMRGASRRGRSPPSDTRRRRMLPRSGGTRPGEGNVRAQRTGEFRTAPRSIPPGSYPQGQYPSVSTQQGSHSPRRTAASKRRSFSPSVSLMASTSGLKRKRIPHPRSSSTSSSSLNSPPRPQHRHQVIKVKKMSAEGIAASREPPVVPLRKQARSKSPIRERGPSSRATSRFNVRGTESSLDGGGVGKGSSYSAGGRAPAATTTSRGFAVSPRQHENPQKRFIGEPIVHYRGVGGGDDGRPVYRGPDGAGPASFSERELKKITIGILRNIPADEPQINRQIVNPEDVVVVRRPDGRFAGAEGIQGEVFRLVNVRTDKGEIVQALSKVLPSEAGMEVGGMVTGGYNTSNGCPSEGSRPIFEREELRLTLHSGDDMEDKYEERERSRRLYRSLREEHPRVEAQQQPIEQRVVAILEDEPVRPSTSHHSHLRGQIRRSRSPLATVSRSGGSRFESISPPPFNTVGIERQGRRAEGGPSYYDVSLSPPLHSRVSGGFGAGAGTRHARDYEQAGPSHTHPGTSSQVRHKDSSRCNADLRYELEYRRRDDASYERGTREFRADSDGASSDLRMRINEKRTTEHHRVTHYHGDDDDATGIHTKAASERRYTMEHHVDVPLEPRRRGIERGGGHRMSGHPEREEPEEFQPRGSFHNKASTSAAPSWDGNPEYVPKGRAYYEHDNRDEWVRMGGGPRGGRGGHYAGGAGNRGRFFRGGFVQRGRGRGRGRASYMGSVNRGYVRGGGGGGIRRVAAHASSVGGGNSSRGKPSSPSLWKHDMFENLSSDENRPTSTTSDTKR